ncbi:response regulator [Paenibacillus sp. BR2-3]|uniref:helix-turn-helix domain-containing protein n=1 Tax=Paenibacillus sp. BR2-3 TaxID=3048494 RepID=UPI00397780F3
MIRVLVVDDDKLVRKGLISAMPWQKFNMHVAGEASNGQKALEFLEGNEVDLLLTDLAMPVMSGIELMRAARQRYPNLHMVALTLHQDFEYIQEVLRLGAIDYIAKVQLEKEQFDDVLARIAGRIHEQAPLNRMTVHPAQAIYEHEQGYVLINLNRESDANGLSDKLLPPGAMEVNSCSWVWFPDEGAENKLFTLLSDLVGRVPGCMLLNLSNLQGSAWRELQQWIREYIERASFYEYHPDRPATVASLKDRYKPYSRLNELELNHIKESWLHSAWPHDDYIFDQKIRDLKAMRLQESQLLGLIYSFAIEWNRLYGQTLTGNIPMIYSVHFWFHVEQWLNHVRGIIRESTRHTAYSKEIMNCMSTAVYMIQEEMSRQLTAAELAQRLNLSRSYFSQCFKDIIGKPFNEYSRYIRVEKAKELLSHTNKTIIWIAEQTGYSDEKYFSRVFRQLTGMLPSEYRANQPGDSNRLV